MQTHYLGRIPFSIALAEQERCRAGEGAVLGFESERVITLGKRAVETVDLSASRADLEAEGFAVFALDRGGQATVHNPGQLVIFPVLPLGEVGPRVWVQTLIAATQATLCAWSVESEWDEARPGLYTKRGKIASIGVRIQGRWSTHGIAINVVNALEDFTRIRVCGVDRAPVDRIGGKAKPELVFKTWVSNFNRVWPLTSPASLATLGAQFTGRS